MSIVERKTGLTLIRKVERKTAQAVSQAMIELLKPHQKKVHTITSDNGKEFAGHEQIANKLKADFYFAHPYASWERGTNENTNGLIRQYFPKNRDFTTITQQEIDTAMEEPILNFVCRGHIMLTQGAMNDRSNEEAAQAQTLRPVFRRAA